MSRKPRSAAAAAASASASSAAPMHDSDDHDDTSADDQPSSSSASAVPARFAGKSLYDVLGVDRGADGDAIKKAYRRMALSCHPDLNKSAHATAEFQYLSKCHEILADKDKRRRYDLSGSIDASQDGGLEDEMAAAAASGDADAYWRSIFPKISLEDIESFRVKYIDSEEEVADAVQAWKQNDGNLQAVFESVPFAGADSVARLCAILNKHCPGAKITRAQQSALKKELASQEGSEAAEAEQALQELSAKEQQIMRASMHGASSSNGHGKASAAAAAASGETGLALIMQQRARDRERSGQSFLSNLQAKYAGGNGSKTKTSGSKRKGKAAAAVEMEDDDEADGEAEESNGNAAHAEPSEDEFAALQAKIMAAKANKTTGASPKKKGRK